MRRILFVINDFSFFRSHRFPIAKACLDRGWEVHLATSKEDNALKKARDMGIKWHGVRLKAGSHNPYHDLLFLKDLITLYKSIKPDILHHVTIKAVLYGSLAARLTRTNSVVNALSGLGYLYINNSLKNKIVRSAVNVLFRIGFKHSNNVLILQNNDDKKLVLANHLIDEEKIKIIRGSGVDKDFFSYSTEEKGSIKIGLPGRMLWDKGVGEFIKAAKVLRKQNIEAYFYLLGAPDPKNPKSIPLEKLQEWNKNENIIYAGFQHDMPRVLKKMHIVCLPSYREGLPKALLEAASVGRPIVATDAPGCRDVVKDNFNGYLVPVKNVELLAEKLKKLIEEPETRNRFGKNGRTRVINEFQIDKVVAETISLYENLI